MSKRTHILLLASLTFLLWSVAPLHGASDEKPSSNPNESEARTEESQPPQSQKPTRSITSADKESITNLLLVLRTNQLELAQLRIKSFEKSMEVDAIVGEASKVLERFQTETGCTVQMTQTGIDFSCEVD